MFSAYFERRLMLPDEDFQLLDPTSLWNVWNFLQTHTYTSVLPNPPSSGFMGELSQGRGRRSCGRWGRMWCERWGRS